MSKIHPRELTLACRVGDLETLKRSLCKISDLNAPVDSYQNRLLHKAAKV